MHEASDAAGRVPLPSQLAVAELAWRSVCLVVSELSAGQHPSPSPQRIAAAYRSDRHLLIDGRAPEVWSPLSRLWKTADGWVRTHGNYPHHASALRRGLSLSPVASADDVALRLRRLTESEAETSIRAAGGICVVVRREDPRFDAHLRERPVVETTRLGHGPARPLPSGSAAQPLQGVRVLDLTRVIAGPVATRTLAFAGADVLRLDSPHLPEFAWQHLDTGHGKRSALLDVRADPQRLERLLHGADVVVLGYRASGLAHLGLSPDALAARHPHLVIAQLTAWPEADSPRGFDSIVQAASGIAWLESPDGGRTPGALPAQALDHSAGYLLAASVVRALHRRAREGGTWWVRTSLRRVAAELLGMPRGEQSRQVAPAPATAELQTFQVGGHRVQTVAPAVTWPGGPDAYRAPRPWGSDEPEW